jgi:hypothetical protein
MQPTKVQALVLGFLGMTVYSVERPALTHLAADSIGIWIQPMWVRWQHLKPAERNLPAV